MSTYSNEPITKWPKDIRQKNEISIIALIIIISTGASTVLVILGWDILIAIIMSFTCSLLLSLVFIYINSFSIIAPKEMALESDKITFRTERGKQYTFQYNQVKSIIFNATWVDPYGKYCQSDAVKIGKNEFDCYMFILKRENTLKIQETLDNLLIKYKTSDYIIYRRMPVNNSLEKK